MEHELMLKQKPSSAQKAEIISNNLLAQREERGGKYRSILFDVPYSVKVLVGECVRKDRMRGQPGGGYA